MKTSELMSKLNKITGIRAFNKSRISVLDSTSECLAQFGTSGSFLNIYKNCPYEVSKLIVEYYLTPLEEREEKTKYYRLMLPDGFSRQFRFLNYDINREHYVFSSSLELGNNRIKFTQKEIDGMPFDTSFLIKEEVV